MAKGRPRSNRRKFFTKPAQRVGAEHENHTSVFETFTGKEVREAMEKAWAKPGTNNPVKKAKWKP